MKLGGVSRQRIHQIYKGYRSTSWNKGQHQKVLDKLGSYCRVCGVGKKLHIHHKDGDRSNNNEDNLQPLCVKHHWEEETRLRKHKPREESFLVPSWVLKKCPSCKRDYLIRKFAVKYRKYCSPTCSGEGKRKYRTEEERKAIQRQHCARYVARNRDKVLRMMREYGRRMYNVCREKERFCKVC